MKALRGFLIIGLLICGIHPLSAAAPAKPINAADFKSALASSRGKIGVLNFWATWCVPCLREVPDLLAVTNEVKASGVVLIGVAVDDPSPGATEVERFRKRYFPEFFTYARQGPEMDELASVIDPTWNEVVPTTYLIDRDGKVIRRIQGKKSAQEFRQIIKEIL